MNRKGSSLSLEDRLELSDLLARYNHAFDEGRGTDVADCFTPDGEFSGPAGEAKGRSELVAFCEASHENIPRSLHVTDHHLFDHASGVVSHRCVLAVHYETTDGVRALLLRYQDELVRHAGEWRFRRRQWPEVAWSATAPRPAGRRATAGR